VVTKVHGADPYRPKCASSSIRAGTLVEKPLTSPLERHPEEERGPAIVAPVDSQEPVLSSTIPLTLYARLPDGRIREAHAGHGH